MNLATNDLTTILYNFPSFKPFYEVFSHKKVHNADIVYASPAGVKCYLWFTMLNGAPIPTPICYVLETDNNTKNEKPKNSNEIQNQNNQNSKTDENIPPQIVNAYICPNPFVLELAQGQNGTLLHGTLFKCGTRSCFSIEEIYFYRNRPFMMAPYQDKLYCIKYILDNELGNDKSTNSNNLFFGIPIINSNFNDLLKALGGLKYDISTIHFRQFGKQNAVKNMYIKYYKPNISKTFTSSTSGTANTNSCAIGSVADRPIVFIVTANIDGDSTTYNLSALKLGIAEFYDTAYIPDYATSAMMKNLFRNVNQRQQTTHTITETDKQTRHHHNFDYLEESDDEDDDGETESISYNMVCQYNNKVKKWTPQYLANSTNGSVVSHEYLRLHT